jgi:hypothetical protein
MPIIEREEAIVDETMLETTPEGRATAAMAQVEPLLDEGAALVDEVVDIGTPVGSYSGMRLNALARVLNKILKDVGSPVEFEETYVDIKAGPMPDTLVRGLLGVKGAVDTFASIEPEEVEMEPYEVSTLIDDKSLAFATAQLDQLFKNKRFRKFLREEEPVIQLDGAPEVLVEEETVLPYDLGQEELVEGSELDILAAL